MRSFCLLATLVLLPFAAASTAQAQTSACQSAQFSEKVLDHFPGAREGCLDVIERDGQKYAVFKADLVRTGPNTLHVRFRRPDGTFGATRSVKVSPARRVLVDGQPVRVEELAAGQELTAYVKVTEPMIALAPPTDVEPLDLQPLESETPQVAANTTVEMPHTAGMMPTFGLSGLALLMLGGVLRALRRETAVPDAE
jgi:hypothetical protein